jgi:hypothetical protein
MRPIDYAFDADDFHSSGKNVTAGEIHLYPLVGEARLN